MLKTIDFPNDKTFKEQTIAVIDSSVSNEFATEDIPYLNAEINRETLKAYLQWKFPDREHNENRNWEFLLLSDLNSAGIKNFNQIEKVVNENVDWLNSFEVTNPPSNS